MTKLLGWLLGLENATAIDRVDPSFSAPWATESPFWVFFGVVCLFILALVFYWRFQQRGSRKSRTVLAVMRGVILALLFLTLANPVLRISLTNVQQPLLYLVFDGTDSMAMQDEYSDPQRRELAAAVGLDTQGETPKNVARIEYVQTLLRKPEANLLQQLTEDKQYRVEAFLFDGNNTSQLRKLELNTGRSDKVDADHVAEQLTTKGQVTALGAALSDVTQQFGAGNLAGVVLFSDFAQNSGVAPVGRTAQSQSPASRLGVPIYAVGIGATETMDVAVDLQTDAKMKRAERTNVQVKLRQTGLQDRDVNVAVTARRLSGQAGSGPAEEVPVGRKTVRLTASLEVVDFPFTPKDAGRFEFMAEAEPLDGEVVRENNRAVRAVNIIDDFLRLMYVAYEPTWEWRFVKEVFHRDKLIGMQGFRTFLASSDPQVRQSNVLFLPTLTPKRSEFFANDVIFLDDMPRGNLSDRFCEMVKDFVSEFGGGLVVIGGPRFGPNELQGTPLADMLPVRLDPDARLRGDREFRPRLTLKAARYPFMQLGENETDTARGWNNLGTLPWYQPVAQVHEQADVLAEHPTDTCRDGKTPQPLIAIRKFGNGEVVYLGFNELWRLRRMYGERYYRAFWSQLIYRLGMSHALGADKRFVVRTDRQQYRAEEKVTLTIEAYNENFEALTDEELPQRTLSAEWTSPGQGGGAEQVRELDVPLLRKGVFEARIPVYDAGEYRVRVKDPVKSQYREVRFEVTALSAERRSGVRNVKLQDDLAAETGGKAYDLTTVSQLADDLQLHSAAETYTRSHPLWCTPLWFGLLVSLMLGEWFYRKMVHLT